MTDTPTLSAQEQSTSARAGAVLFRHRSWLPVPFLVVTLLVPGTQTIARTLVAAVLIALGEWVRLAGIAAAGTTTRRRSRDVQRLVTYGIFGWVRNPLYVGNLLVWFGFVVASGIVWFLPIAAVVFAIEYTLIVAYEEGVLESIFGDVYVAYKGVTPRWFPRRPASPEDGPIDWGEAWVSERSTFLQYLALAIAFSVKYRLTR